MRTAFGVFVNGGYGVGKSAVLDHVDDLLADQRRPFALMDVDWFHPVVAAGCGRPDNVSSAES